MEISSKPADAITRHAAQRAAKAAAGAFSQTTPLKTTGFSNHAVYAWAFVAFMGTAVAGSALMEPGLNPQMASAPAVDKIVTASLDSNHQASTPEPNQMTTSAEHPISDEQTIGEHADPFPTNKINATQTVEVEIASTPDTSVFGSAAIIGPPTDIRSLLLRYASLKQKKPELISKLVPMVQFLDETDNPMTNLVAGPFIDNDERDEFCSELTQNISLSCSASIYSGEPLFGD